jgi:hypothetical protein
MRPKAWIVGPVALGVILSAAFAFSQTPPRPPLCGRVVTAGKLPAASAAITLRNRIAITGVNGSFCLRGIDHGEYDVIVQWKGIRRICHIEVGRDNLCVMPE